MRCEGCGSVDLDYERDALLIATVVAAEGSVLKLDAAPRPAPLDGVLIACRTCGREQKWGGWEGWRPLHCPSGEEPLEADEVLDMVAGYINPRSEVQGADFLEFVSRLLVRSGREVVDGDG
jgi:hypothetical protein